MKDILKNRNFRLKLESLFRTYIPSDPSNKPKIYKHIHVSMSGIAIKFSIMNLLDYYKKNLLKKFFAINLSCKVWFFFEWS